MNAESIITIWHFDEASQEFVRRVFQNVYFHISKKIAKSGIKEKGFHSAGTAVVRIPTEDDIDVVCGDYIALGECSEIEPYYSDAFKIMEVCDNRRGASPHWKLSCGGGR